jgi:uncharacterized coiled-coil DUF342 family protein
LTPAADDGIVVSTHGMDFAGPLSQPARCGDAPQPIGGRAMAPQPLETRVESLEQRVTRLDALPGRMDRLESQIVQLRTEMHDEFSAVREEIRTGGEEIHGAMGELATRREMREEFAAVRQEIRTGDEETRHYMRMLFEDYIARMKTIDEGKDGRT